MAELTAVGSEPHQRWQKPIPAGESVCLGRAPRQGWRVPWDIMISREHANIEIINGQVVVRCLETARNPILYRDQPCREFRCGAGETFTIGTTRFLISESIELKPSAGIEERSFAPHELRSVSFADPTKQMELIATIPELIRTTTTDEELAVRLVGLLLSALPRADVAAVVQYEDLSRINNGIPTMMRWDSRTVSVERFTPSKRLMEKALISGQSIVHQWNHSAADESAQAFTICDNLDWAICTPLKHESCRGWCLYVSGKSPLGLPVEKMMPDLRFVELMAEFIGSVRQIRQLERLQAGMSHFFSPTVMETLTADKAKVLLQPREGDISVLFCDVRGFSRLIERQQSEMMQLLDRVSRALSIMTRGIMKHDGIIADFQGDAALGFWGWPVALIDGPLPACQAALEIREQFSQVSKTPGHPLTDFRVGIGVSHGRAVAGSIGSELQVKVGVFGHVVNLGARLEGMTRILGVPLLVDEATAAVVVEAGSAFPGRVRRLGRFRPSGFVTPTGVYELYPVSSEEPILSEENVKVFESAVDLFEKGDWSRCVSKLESIPESDGARQFLMGWITKSGGRPPESWDGIISLDSKS